MRNEGNILAYCTLAEMIDKDYLCDLPSKKAPGKSFTIGKKGRKHFYMWDPTPNGFYKIYEQNERGAVTGVRYVDANEVMVTVWKNIK